jgi:hypothetical protein
MPVVKDFTSMIREVEPMLTVHRGLYVQYLTNKSDRAVYDRNGKGKLIIPKRGRTIKIGKFEGGLLARRTADAIHMHRRPQTKVPPHHNNELLYAPELGTYIDCLSFIVVLDMGSPPKKQVRAAEGQLRERLNQFLRNEGISVANFRGDYRILSSDSERPSLTDLQVWANDTLCAIANIPARS